MADTPRVIEFQGRRHEFPAGTTDAQISAALGSQPKDDWVQPTPLQKARQQYPQYNDMSDADFASALHSKFYSDMPRATFDAKMGLPDDWAAFELAPQQPTSGTEAFGRGMLNSATFNFLDELHGLARAGGLDPADPNVAHALGALAKGAYSTLRGNDPEAERLYREQRDVSRAQTQQFETEHPAASLAGNVAGGLALPLGGALSAATLPARIGRGAAVGAGVGGLSGFGRGEGLQGSLAGAGIGVGIGAGVGAAAPPLVEGALNLGRAALSPITNTIRGTFNPEGEAARRVIGAIRRDVAEHPTGTPGLTPAEFQQNVAQGGPATLMDMGGTLTRRLADSAATTSPEGGAALNRTINDRFESQSGRIGDWLRSTFAFPNATAQQRAIEQSARTTNNAAYRQAYQEGSGGLWSPELERLAGSDAVSSAMQAAAKSAKDEAIVGGYGAMNPRITFTQDGRIQFNRGPNGVPTYPDLQYWDLTRRELSDAARRAGSGTSEARRLNAFASAMNTELDRLVPSYQQARQGAASFFGAENALEAGQNFATARFANDRARDAVSRMSHQERQLFQDGFVSRFIDKIEASGDRTNIAGKLANSPAEREKLAIALGPQRARELEANLHVERIMDTARDAVQGNSRTAQRLHNLGLAGGAGIGSIGAYYGDPSAMTSGAILAVLSRGGKAIDQRIARRVADMLVSNDPAVLARGMATVTRSDAMMNALRRGSTRIGLVPGAEQGAPVLRVADDEQRPSPLIAGSSEPRLSRLQAR